MSKVTTYVMGGAANQMFQFAAGYALAKKRNAELFVDRSRFDDNSGEFRMYSLGLFQGTNSIPSRRPDGTEYLIKEPGLPYNPSLFENISADADVWIFGYWQTEKYFAEYKKELKEIFQPYEWNWSNRSQETLNHILEAGSRSVFLTVRRTDYVNNPYHGILDMDYYNTALDTIASKVGGNLTVFVFSDEPEWCEANLKLEYRQVIAGNFDRTIKPHLGREDVELYLMRNCQHAVLANSSYSWWGSWLGKSDESGLVVAPKQWFLSDKADSRDIVPERWIRL